ncbi:glutathione S-transferase family protein [Sabulicella rubraurantiaca]|uniref:glutathione S-transferase family protein n=1 Tax=Sabulicella rubraurantiaca TaxID=2811429 RepID=UPI001A964E9E|nr:glutathione S-transferase family protein [Sabulicella rubraurantiaca]
MLTIWGRASSSNVMKLLFLCEELGLPFERLDAGGSFGRTNEASYLAMNPMARVPTIVEEDGFSLWESNSILRYLVARHAPSSPLHPADPHTRAGIEKWMDWQLGHLNAPMTTILFTLYRTPEPERDRAALARAEAEAAALWGIVETALEGRDWLSGDALSLAEIALAPYLHRWLNFPITRPETPRLKALHGMLMTRPGFARHVAVPIT